MTKSNFELAREFRLSPGIDTHARTSGICQGTLLRFPSGTKAFCKQVRLNGAVVAYQFAQWLGFNRLVPLTIDYGRHPVTNRSRTLIHWISGASSRLYQHGVSGFQTKSLREFVLFDALTATVDRHGENWLVDSKQRIIAIDNEGAFQEGDWCSWDVHRQLTGHPLTPAHTKLVERLRLYQDWPLFLRRLNSVAKDGLHTRALAILERGSYC